jgi:hypothetical protein
MKLPDLFVNAVATFDGKALAKGQKTVASFAKNVAKSLGLAFGTAAVIGFGKASIKAFAEDETAAIRLTKAVENLGLGFEDTKITRFIQDLEKSAAVSDDVLRPAFQSLISTTGSVSKSQELLALALEISAGSGVDAAEVAKDLSLAYLGQSKGIAKYNTGLTKTELAATGFLTIQEKLTAQYSGQNAARLDTYSGKVSAVQIAYGNLQETVGGALIDAFAKLAGDTTTEDLTESVDNLADSLASVVELAGQVATPFVGLAKLFNDASMAYTKLLYKVTGTTFMGTVNDRLYGGAAAEKYKSIEEASNAKARAKAEAEANKRAKELLAIQKKSAAAALATAQAKKLALAIDKANLVLGKGLDIFDMEQIQIGAALTNQAEQLAKSTSGVQALQIANDTARLNVKRSILELENAIAAKDEAAIIAATSKLNADILVLGALTGQELKLQEIKKILDGLASKTILIDIDTNSALAKIKALYASASAGIVIPVSLSGTATAATATGAPGDPVNIGGLYSAIGSNFKEYLVQTGALSSGLKQGGGEFNYNITVNTGIGDPNAIANEIVTFLNNAKANGTLTNGILSTV